MMAVSSSPRRDDSPRDSSADRETLKRELYENIPPGRRKFIDRIGYDHWDPFQKPNDPVELRTDVSQRTTRELVREFLQSLPPDRAPSSLYSRGALECALGIVNRDDKCLGMVDFALWYHDLLKKEGRLP
jgi:hypothetical protein